MEIIEGFSNPSKATNLQTHAGFPLEYGPCPALFSLHVDFDFFGLARYFARLTDQLAHRLQTYKSTVDVSHKLS
jgi:hypothetical protein